MAEGAGPVPGTVWSHSVQLYSATFCFWSRLVFAVPRQYTLEKERDFSFGIIYAEPSAVCDDYESNSCLYSCNEKTIQLTNKV